MHSLARPTCPSGGGMVDIIPILRTEINTNQPTKDKGKPLTLFEPNTEHLWHEYICSPAQWVVLDHLVLVKALTYTFVPCPLLDLGEATTCMNDLSHDLHRCIEGCSSKCYWCDIAVTLQENHVKLS